MNASKKQRRSKTTELRPNNEDLGKNTGSLLIVWQAALQRSRSIFSSLLMPFTHFSQIGKGKKEKKTGQQMIRMRVQMAACLTWARRVSSRRMKFTLSLPASLLTAATAIKKLRDQQTQCTETASWNPDAARGRRRNIPLFSTFQRKRKTLKAERMLEFWNNYSCNFWLSKTVDRWGRGQ